jgi:hypothetical protein
MKSLTVCIVALAVALSWAAPLAAGPVFVVVGSDNTSLLTVELQNGKAVITNTQSLTPSVAFFWRLPRPCPSRPCPGL